MAKQNNTDWMLAITIGALLLVLIVTSGCFEAQHQQSAVLPSTGTQDTGDNGGIGIPSEPKLKGMVVGVKNYEAIYANLVAVTGINRATCQNEFNTQQTALPEFNDLNAMGAAAQSGLIKLASCVCRAAIDQNQNGGRTRLTPTINYGTTAANLTPQQLSDGINSLLDAAWGPAVLEHQPDRATTLASLVTSAQGIIQDDANRASTAATRRVMFGMCVAAFASPGAQVL